MYSTPRAATVVSKGEGVCWQLDRDTFNHIVKGAASKKRERYASFLEKVPLLSGMDNYERTQLADALRTEEFAADATIVTQGEPGSKFYIVEEGAAIATKSGVEVMKYGIGDYFGELALIRNQPRAATVTAQTPVKLLTLDSCSFKRMLDVSAMMQRAQDRYA
uniref:Cyclic nucleotide-binding domain-containing protein n=1 Tax=Zooxanthella nutricula TaxID=1333877 RepID=A0A7S2JDF9_9DINO